MATACRLRALGLVTAYGTDLATTWSRLLRGERTQLTARTNFVAGREIFVGAVADDCLREIPRQFHLVASRNSQLSFAAIDQIRDQIEQLKAAVGADRIGVVAGTSTSGIATGEIAHRERKREGEFPAWYDFSQQEMGSTARAIAEYAGVDGPLFTVSTACSSSAKVFGDARALLSSELCDGVIVGGVDSLCNLTVQGFSALELVAPALANPMSKNRQGLNIGEGAALFLMTREAGGIQLAGIGESCDAYHMSAPEPNGRGAEEAMRAALRDAGMNSSDIAYINLHGTGTQHNDSSEGKAIASLFGPNSVPCSSVKQLVGHTLGAAGAIEAAVCYLALENAEEGSIAVPPHIWDGVRDESLPEIRLVNPGETLPFAKHAAVMSNSFAFGGNNCALVFSR